MANETGIIDEMRTGGEQKEETKTYHLQGVPLAPRRSCQNLRVEIEHEIADGSGDIHQRFQGFGIPRVSGHLAVVHVDNSGS